MLALHGGSPPSPFTWDTHGDDHVNMATTDGGVFLAWDPVRACKAFACAGCGKACAKLKCGACRFASYCSKECHRRHWPAHQRACGEGYGAYIGRAEAHTQEVARLQREGESHASIIASYERMLADAQSMGDSEGARHLHRVLAFRLELLDEHDKAAAHAAGAEALEAVLGKPPPSRLMDSVTAASKLPPLTAPAGAPAAALSAPAAPAAPVGADKRHVAAGKFVRGAKQRTTSWGGWEQSWTDITATLTSLPPGVALSRIRVDIGPRELSVGLQNCQFFEAVVGGRLCGECRVGDSSWARSGCELTVVLEKAVPGVWDALFESELEAHAASESPRGAIDPGGAPIEAITPPPPPRPPPPAGAGAGEGVLAARDPNARKDGRLE